jgi:predicted anti-sigma-YlaC factor YlaD
MDREHCRHLLGELSAYLDGELSEAICVEIERHLVECADCRIVVDTLRKTILLYRTAPQPGFPAAARERLYKALNLTEFL